MNYQDYGIFLLDDKFGARVKTLAAPHQLNSEPILKAILNEWYEGKGQPVTWGVLIACLRDCTLNALVSDIEKYVATLE